MTRAEKKKLQDHLEEILKFVKRARNNSSSAAQVLADMTRAKREIEEAERMLKNIATE